MIKVENENNVGTFFQILNAKPSKKFTCSSFLYRQFLSSNKQQATMDLSSQVSAVVQQAINDELCKIPIGTSGISWGWDIMGA